MREGEGAHRALVFAGKARGSVAVGVPAVAAPRVRLLVGTGVFGASAAHAALPVFTSITGGNKRGPVNQPAQTPLTGIASCSFPHSPNASFSMGLLSTWCRHMLSPYLSTAVEPVTYVRKWASKEK